ncbi:protein Wnt-2b-A-like [Oppia nitens]|uniref:protein Wnt-2b-A-like n=1 Tax=Oppia nitens TaxID=1686743 RepID=UPI0023DA07E6|nr:protein Wnt-2b-A-like [Oppia nitens]
MCQQSVLLSQYDGGDSRLVCRRIPGLDRQQRQLCAKHPQLMRSLASGVRLAIDECQRQFASHRWNCTTSPSDSTLFGRHVINALSRETAFIYAITSAGAVYSIARWCSGGTGSQLLMTTGCTSSCDLNRLSTTTGSGGRGWDSRGQFSWGGCSPDLRSAARFVHQFTDTGELANRDSTAAMYLHNNQVGRQAVLRTARIVCKCHGVSASCLARTCWRTLPSFRTVSNRLMDRYRRARHVRDSQTTQMMAHRLPPPLRQRLSQTRGRRHHYYNRIGERDASAAATGADQLIYLDVSPDYCHVNPKQGLYGTEGRQCNKTSTGTDSCEHVCCGSGYRTERLSLSYRCQCKFYWCCYVKCQVCTKIQTLNTCRSY